MQMKEETMNYRIDYCCISNRGRVRTNNEDNFLCAGKYMPQIHAGTEQPIVGSSIASDNPVFAVFDGMGGESEGERASFIAAQSGATYAFSPPGCETLRAFSLEANRHICDYMDRAGIPSMGTTEALLQFHAQGVSLCNLGDSRIMRWRDGVMTQLSQDHLLDSARGKKSPLLQYLGIPEDEMQLQPYLATITPQFGDRFLICSDGLTDMLGMGAISRALNSTQVVAAAHNLVSLALEAGGRDNITLIVSEVRNDRSNMATEKLSVGKRIGKWFGRWLRQP